ncbi:MAG: hypothetical protein ACK44N_08925 [Bacteroidota bacterium]|jgi:hypothetical protein
MKKLLFLFALIILSFQGISQSTSPTTDEEFNMATTGYKMYLQMGLPMKPGYRIVDFKEYEYGERKMVLKGLYRPTELKPCAMIIAYSRLRGAPEYYCIPSPDADELLWDRFRVSLAGEIDNKQEQLQFLSFALGKALSFYAAK